MTVSYLDGMYEILSYPYGLELTVKRVMTNIRHASRKEKEPGLFKMSCQLSAIKRGDLTEFESSMQGLKDTIRHVELSPRWLELLPKRLDAEEAKKAAESWKMWRVEARSWPGRVGCTTLFMWPGTLPSV